MKKKHLLPLIFVGSYLALDILPLYMLLGFYDFERKLLFIIVMTLAYIIYFYCDYCEQKRATDKEK